MTDYEKDLDTVLMALKEDDLLKPEQTTAILAEFNSRMLAKIATQLEILNENLTKETGM